MDEVIFVDKPKGMTSFGVVSRLRRILTEKMREEYTKRGETAPKRLKVGHTGTLDPFATGLLIVLVGKATKKCERYLKMNKEYIAKIKLGETSTTGDPEGFVQKIYTGRPISGEKIKNVVQSFQGKIQQTVPSFSAVKIDGERAYKLARRGEKVEMPTREVEVFQIEILKYEWPILEIRAKVSSGTYIRTLGEDIGKKLGTGAYLTELRRTKIGEFDVKDARELSEFGIFS
ncbi:tRNA pseudouridine(55) synthase TruB [Candidatus Saccharibacteria bacterium]|nr:tRNA pseudouridine(55) synthase TruB [Candidatus Saccharibacteria bacterium]